MLGSLDHSAIIRMIDCDYADPETKSGPFLVMEYFDGQTLEELVSPTSLVPVDEAVTLFRLVAEGMGAAHAKGVCHRDIKPANLLVRREPTGWRAKIIDFGLALRRELTQTAMSASTSRQGKTLVGESIAGTLHYAAPEQMDPHRQKEVGPWSDVYSFGKTCYYALFGTPTPDDDDKDRLPDGLKRLLSRCTSQAIAKRPQSFTEVVAQLSKAEESLVPTLEEAGKVLEESVKSGRSQSGVSPETSAQPTASFSGNQAHRKKTPAQFVPLRCFQGDASYVHRLAFSHNQRFALSSAAYDTDVRLWDVQSGQEVRRFAAENHAWVYGVSFSPDDQFVLAGAGQNAEAERKGFQAETLWLWDISSGERVHSFGGYREDVMCVAFTPDGRSIVSNARKPGALRIWDAATGKQVRLLEGHTGSIGCLAVSSDGRQALSGGTDLTVRAWDLVTGKELQRLVGHESHLVRHEDGFIKGGSIISVAFTPDNRYALSGGTDKTVRVWSLEEEKELNRFQAQTEYVRSVTFSVDGCLALISTQEKTLQLWDVMNGCPLHRMETGDVITDAVAFSLDGSLVLSGGNKTIRLFRLLT